MGALRWILLVAGVAFLAGLVWWESRRARRHDSGEYGAAWREAPPPSGGHGPTAMVAERAAPRAAAQSLPLVQLPSDGDEFGFEPMLAQPSVDACAGTGLADMRDIEAADPMDAQRHGDTERSADHAAHAEQSDAGIAGDMSGQNDPSVGLILGGRLEPSVGDICVPELQPAATQATPAQPPELVVEWPDENQRRILSLRVVTRGVERFPGRALRQALAGSGFLHGRFGIFHLPGADGRALISAASLSRPGILDPDNMDFQRFAGLNIFAVLPGALSTEQTFERLLQTGEELAMRLNAKLQDEQGVDLDAGRVGALRRALAGPGDLRAEPVA